MIRVLALDLSLTSTGVATPDGHPDRLRTTLTGTRRLAHIRDQVLELARDTWPDLIAIEGYAFARPNQAHQIGELGGVIRLALTEHHHSWITVPPSTVKKYATGTGNAGKPQVTAAAIRRLDYAAHHDDEADALWIRAAVADAAGHPIVNVPATHREAITHRAGTKAKPRPSLTDRVTQALAVDQHQEQ